MFLSSSARLPLVRLSGCVGAAYGVRRLRCFLLAAERMHD